MAKKSAQRAANQAAPEVTAAKRDFYVITPLDRSSLDRVETIDNEEFKDRVLNYGGRFDGVFPPDYKIWLKRGKPSDLLGGPQSWSLVSSRFVEAVGPLMQGQVAVFPVPMFDVKTKKPVHDYKLLHVLGSLSAVATIDGKLRIHFGTGIVYDGAKIPPTTNIFRMGEDSAEYVVVSGELRQTLKKAGVATLEYLETSTI